MSPHPLPSPNRASRGMALLFGALLTMVVLIGGSVLFTGGPESAISGPAVGDGNIR